MHEVDPAGSAVRSRVAVIDIDGVALLVLVPDSETLTELETLEVADGEVDTVIVASGALAGVAVTVTVTVAVAVAVLITGTSVCSGEGSEQLE